ncbi:MAG: S1 family peptidase [Bythopirellula sp.]
MAPSTLRSTFPTGKSVPQTLERGPQSLGAGMTRRNNRPHPAVARIVVPEQGATSYGSGTLIDIRDDFGLVITNWHVVRDATGTIEVMFPDGFTSKARALKVDSDWDLAALVIWRPTIAPVKIADEAPQPGDVLTICGYGQGMYRCATGRCTQYYAPRLDFPRHMVELDVEARQGDSGGPIFDQRGELAGVLFGAGQGTTLGSFGGRVGAFLASLAPDIGRAEEALAQSAGAQGAAQRTATLRPADDQERQDMFASNTPADESAVAWPEEFATMTSNSSATAESSADLRQPASPTHQVASEWQPVRAEKNTFEQMKTVLAAIGLLSIVVQVLRVAR